MRAAVLGVALLGLAWTAPAHAAKAVPPAPYYYVLDEQGVLSEAELRALQTLLVEHDRVTGEQIVLAVFKSLEGEDLVAFTNRVFSEWKIGQRGKDNGVLLALYWDERQARIEVGYGLEPVLTDAQTKRVLDEALIPGLKADEPGRALSAAATEILRVLESPLLANGKAEEILRAGFARNSARQGSRGEGASWALWVLVGLALVISALFRLLAADAHYTGQGWHRPRRRTVFWGGGGGSWGGGGGFRGGGGSSGGGGASGSW